MVRRGTKASGIVTQGPRFTRRFGESRPQFKLRLIRQSRQPAPVRRRRSFRTSTRRSRLKQRASAARRARASQRSAKTKRQATVRRVRLTRAKRKGASRVSGLTVRATRFRRSGPSTIPKTRTAGQRERKLTLVSVPRKRKSTIFGGIFKGAFGPPSPISQRFGGQGAARTKPRINIKPIPPRETDGQIFVSKPEIQEVIGGSIQDQAVGFAKSNPIIIGAGVLAAVLLLRR